MPASPYHGQVRSSTFRRARNGQRIGDWRPGEHGDSEAHRLADVREHRALGVGIDAGVDDHHFVAIGMEPEPMASSASGIV